jgi:N-acetylmuramoyl-L-alanine amidase
MVQWVMKLRKAAGTVLGILVVLVVCSVFQWYTQTTAVTSSCTRAGERVLILDAGHGGEDGGAVSVSGVAESGINLAIVEKVDQLAGLYGIPVILTRTDDTSLADSSASTLREKKRSDLYNRVALINNTSGACLLSIHQNNYANHSVHGAQVFYRDSEEGKRWATLTQSALRTEIDPENERVCAVIPDSVYLLNHIDCPAILVECGFLSNSAEDQKLQQDSYQSSLAATIFTAYIQYFTGDIVI